MRDGDTIVALSSGAPPSGVAVIRLSGPGSGRILRDMLGELPEPRRLRLADIVLGGERLDRGLVAWMPGPQSFTGEDCAELQVHGSPATVRAILRALTGVPRFRLAEAGEFTRRAFENGKLDLTEVEGLGDLISAETENQRRQALARAAGGLSQKIDAWRESLLDARAEIEAQLDFSDESDVGQLPPSVKASLERLASELEGLGDQGTWRGRVVREGLRVALAGAPNAGKSSLINALARSDIAIVTPEAGTTRDVREVAVDLGGQLVILLDMAGLRATSSLAEAEGVRRAEAEIMQADLVLWLVAPDAAAAGMPETEAPVWRVATKADIGRQGTGDHEISTLTGEGMPSLLDALTVFAADAVGTGEPSLVSRERDKIALEAAARDIRVAIGRMDAAEVAAEALRSASMRLERLLGRVDAEAVLDRLFSSFCIGK